MANILKGELDLLDQTLASNAFVEIVPAPGVQLSGADGVRADFTGNGSLRIPLGALHSGLPQVGVLVSSRYASLHPGYYVIFSGIYSSLEEAQSAVSKASTKFPSAYARQISP